MKTFILILLFWDSSHGGSSMTSVEFTSREKCEVALAASHQTMDSSAWGYSKAYGVCVEK